MKLPNFMNPLADNSPKIGHDFINKGVQKLKLGVIQKLQGQDGVSRW